MENGSINKQYKDRLFNFIFGNEDNREWTLQLYNAINGSAYTDASQIEFNTLKEVLYIGMRNDTSFLISDIMSVYEHQSSYNPNMPLRLLQYVGDLYSGYVTKHKLNKYGSTLLRLPVPKLVVFYNGRKETDDVVELRLSDSFPEEHREDSDIEVRVKMININYGRNVKLLEACKPLEEYAWFINEININLENGDVQAAVKKAIRAMPQDYVIREFILNHRAEVEGMLDTEYNEAEVKELFVEEGRREGIKEGIKEGIQIFILDKLGENVPDKTIIEKVMNLFNLTEEQANQHLDSAKQSM